MTRMISVRIQRTNERIIYDRASSVWPRTADFDKAVTTCAAERLRKGDSVNKLIHSYQLTSLINRKNFGSSPKVNNGNTTGTQCEIRCSHSDVSED
jgi:hypothetical protein